MDRIIEIEERLSAIANEVEAPEADLNALEEEVRSLKAEREELNAKAEQRAKLLSEVEERGKTVESFEELKVEKMEERTFTIDSAEYRSAWLKNLQGNKLDEVEERAFSQASTNAVPTMVSDHFFEKMKKMAPMLNEVTLMRVAGNLKFVAEGNREAAYQHTENATITSAGDTTVYVTLGAIEFAKVIGISKSAKMMSIDAFEDWLVQILAGDIARAIDSYIINDATHGIDSITWTSGTNLHVDTASTWTFGTITNLIKLLPAAYDAEAKFLVNKKTLWGKIANIVTSAGQPIFVQNTEEGMVGRLCGYPVLVDDYVTSAKDTVYLGAFKNVVANLSEGPAVESDASSGFLSATINYRGYASFDSAVAQPYAFAKLVSTN